jgi:hypothetical protein
MSKTIRDLILKEARKATSAFIVALIGTGGTAMLDGNLTASEATVACGTALVATAAVYGFKNKPASK